MSVVVRIRSSTGTARVSVPPGTSLAGLISMANLPPTTVLSTDPSGAGAFVRQNNATLESLSIKHGDMLHVVEVREPVSPSSKTMSSTAAAPPSSSAAAPASSGSGAATNVASSQRKCTHPTNATCVFCAPPRDPNEPVKDRTLSSKATGKGEKIKWLCQHGPGSKCVNCLKVTKKDKAKKPKCTHPPQMKCVNCMNAAESSSSEEEDDDEEGKPKAHKLTDRCMHGPKGMCALCMPKPTASKGAEGSKCRNHGPHGSCIDCIAANEAVKHKIQLQKAAHAKACSLDRRSAQVFQDFLQQTAFTHHRVGFLYGKVTEQGTRVDAIYEPPQDGNGFGWTLNEENSKEHAKVDELCSLLGLEHVGVIYSHPRRKKKVPMTGKELAVVARLANAVPVKRRKGFVVVTIQPDSEGNSSFESFQLSDQLLVMQKQGILADVQTHDTTLSTKSPVIVEGSETTESDVHFFVNNVPIMDHVGPFRVEFPIENRPVPQFDVDLSVCLAKGKNLPFAQRLGDFHVLLYLTKYLDMKTDFPSLCKAVVDKDDQACDGFKLIIEAIAQAQA